MALYRIHDLCTLQEAKEENDFVGLKMKEGRPYIYLPLGYNQEKEITGKDIDLLLTSIKKLAPKEESENIVNDTFTTDDDFPYFAFKWILQDYLEHGYFKDTELIEKTSSQGKINWKKTIYQKNPIITKQGPIYHQFIVRKNKYQEDNIITKLHQFCVYESEQMIGWIFPYNITLEKPTLSIDNKNKKRYIKIIKEELKNTFQDNKKELLCNMIQILTGVDTSKRGYKIRECGTRKYYVVWEKMIDEAYGNVVRKELYYPKGTWTLANQTVHSTPLRPDTIWLEKEKAYIYDAKYYAYCNHLGNINKLPQTDSIQKQITYAEYIDYYPKFSHIKTIYNIFLLPGNIKEKIQYLGHASSDWKDGTKEYHKIYTFLLDTRYTIENYNRKKQKAPQLYIENLEKNKK